MFKIILFIFTIIKINSFNIFNGYNIKNYNKLHKKNTILLSLEEEFYSIKKHKIFINNNLIINNEDNLSNELTLITNKTCYFMCIEWFKYMYTNNSIKYQKYLYKDLANMIKYINTRDNYLSNYIAFKPYFQDSFNGPYYIAVLDTDYKTKTIYCNLIIQNPKYIYDDNFFLQDFKESLKIMSLNNNLVFNFSNLEFSNERYWLAWNSNI